MADSKENVATVVLYKLVDKKETKVYPFKYYQIKPITISQGKVKVGELFEDEARKWELCKAGGVINRAGPDGQVKWSMRSLKAAALALYDHIYTTLKDLTTTSGKEKAYAFRREYYLKLRTKYREYVGYDDDESDDLPTLDKFDSMFSQTEDDDDSF